MDASAKRLRHVEREIENINKAIKSGRATESLLAMLEEVRAREEGPLCSSGATPGGREPPAERALDTLPGRVQSLMNDLETLLANKQVDAGRAILAALATEITLTPNRTGLIAHVRGSAGKVLHLVATGKTREVQNRWLGEATFSEVYSVAVQVRVAA